MFHLRNARSSVFVSERKCVEYRRMPQQAERANVSACRCMLSCSCRASVSLSAVVLVPRLGGCRRVRAAARRRTPHAAACRVTSWSGWSWSCGGSARRGSVILNARQCASSAKRRPPSRPRARGREAGGRQRSGRGCLRILPPTSDSPNVRRTEVVRETSGVIPSAHPRGRLHQGGAGSRPAPFAESPRNDLRHDLRHLSRLLWWPLVLIFVLFFVMFSSSCVRGSARRVNVVAQRLTHQGGAGSRPAHELVGGVVDAVGEDSQSLGRAESPRNGGGRPPGD